jgi:hypothetical protein
VLAIGARCSLVQSAGLSGEQSHDFSKRLPVNLGVFVNAESIHVGRRWC